MSLISRLSSTPILEPVLSKAKSISTVSAHPAAPASLWTSHRPSHDCCVYIFSLNLFPVH